MSCQRAFAHTSACAGRVYSPLRTNSVVGGQWRVSPWKHVRRPTTIQWRAMSEEHEEKSTKAGLIRRIPAIKHKSKKTRAVSAIEQELKKDEETGTAMEDDPYEMEYGTAAGKRDESTKESEDIATQPPSSPAKKQSSKEPMVPLIPIYRMPNRVRLWRRANHKYKQTVGLVPTMGALHSGHLELVKQAAKECEHVLVSIYVNPTQFGPKEDLANYPKNVSKDMSKLMQLNRDIADAPSDYRGKVSAVFMPSTEVMYQFGLDSPSYMQMNPSMTQALEGKSRPTFFQGVTTIVMKLLNIVQPDMVYFGQKDIQQLAIIQRMIREFYLPVQLRRVKTSREGSGLALSSRNVFLGQRRQQVATALSQALFKAFSLYTKDGKVTRKDVLNPAMDEAARLQALQRDLDPSKRARFEIDYLSLADPTTLKEVDVIDEKCGAILSGAMVMLPLEDIQPAEKLGVGGDMRTVRLIDNFLLGSAKGLLGAPLDRERTKERLKFLATGPDVR